MANDSNKSMPDWALPALSWLVSFYFLLGFVSNMGFPPDRKLFVGDAVYVALWLLFLFLPFYKKVKIGNLLELEKEVTKAKEELKEFKAEVRNSLSVLSTNVNTIGSMTNHITVNIPGLAELREAKQVLKNESGVNTTQTAEKVEESIALQSEDPTFALARTRIEIERLLRKNLGKKSTYTTEKDETIKYIPINKLFDLFISQNQQFSYLKQPFQYTMQICNAAMHALKVSDEQTQEALSIGAQIIAVLKQRAGETGETE